MLVELRLAKCAGGSMYWELDTQLKIREHPQSLLERHNQAPDPLSGSILSQWPGDLIAHQFWSSARTFWTGVTSAFPRAVLEPSRQQDNSSNFCSGFSLPALCPNPLSFPQWPPTRPATPTSAYWSHQHNPTLPALGFSPYNSSSFKHTRGAAELLGGI